MSGPTIDTLPAELLGMILFNLGLQDGPSIYYCALVQSSWTQQALKYLYEALVIPSQDRAKVLVQPGCGFWKFPVRNILFIGSPPPMDSLLWSPEMTQVVEKAAPDLKTLMLMGIFEVDPMLFITIQFPALKQVNLACGYAEAESSTLPTSFHPLSLDSLNLAFDQESGESGARLACQIFVKSIFRSPTPSPPTLALSLGSIDQPFLALFQPLKDIIKVITLTLYNSIEMDFVKPLLNGENLSTVRLELVSNKVLKVVLKNVTSDLKNLQIGIDRDGMGRDDPDSEEDEEEEEDMRDSVLSTVKILKEAFEGTSLPKLEKFGVIMGQTQEALYDGWNELAKLLDERRIRFMVETSDLAFDEDSDDGSLNEEDLEDMIGEAWSDSDSEDGEDDLV